MSSHISRKKGVKTNQLTKDQLYQKIENRLFRIFNYFSIYLFILTVYSGAIITDYLIFALMYWLLRDDVQRYPAVSIWFDFARIGLAMLFILAAIIHGVISTWGQIRLDLALSRESELT